MNVLNCCSSVLVIQSSMDSGTNVYVMDYSSKTNPSNNTCLTCLDALCKLLCMVAFPKLYRLSVIDNSYEVSMFVCLTC